MLFGCVLLCLFVFVGFAIIGLFLVDVYGVVVVVVSLCCFVCLFCVVAVWFCCSWCVVLLCVVFDSVCSCVCLCCGRVCRL